MATESEKCDCGNESESECYQCGRLLCDKCDEGTIDDECSLCDSCKDYQHISYWKDQPKPLQIIENINELIDKI